MELNYQEEELVELLEETVDEQLNDLVVFNDDVNTFEHVTNILIKVCKHSSEQAEQCTYIIHFKGKCKVKNGTFKELKPLCENILEAGISASIL